MSEIDSIMAPFFFFVHNKNHVRLLAPVADRLRAQGCVVTFVDLEAWHYREGAVPELQRLSLSSVSIEDFVKSPPSRGVFVLANDWVPDGLTEFLDRPRRDPIKLVGVIDGCRFALPERYTRVDCVLGWGPSSRICFKQTVIVTGSPIIEAAGARRVCYSAPPLVAVNYKFTYEYTDKQARFWSASVMRACEKAALPFAFSAHPSNRIAAPAAIKHIDRVTYWGASLMRACEKAALPFMSSTRSSRPMAPQLPIEDIDTLLDRASVLVTRPSTVAYEAMVRGIPVVLFPMRGEPLAEFGQPMDAFEVTCDVDVLPDLISSALRTRDGYKSRCRNFLEYHVELGTQGMAIARIVMALATIAAEV
jgi:hypothetical protein